MRHCTRRLGLSLGSALSLFMVGACAETAGLFERPSEPSASIVDRALNAARDARANGDLDTASRRLAYLASVAPDNAAVLEEYGKTLIEMGRPDDGLVYLNKALAYDSHDWKTYNAIAVAYDEKHDFASATGAYAKALALSPGNPSILANDARSRTLAGDENGAQALLAEASGQAKVGIAGDAEQSVEHAQALSAQQPDPGLATALRTDAPGADASIVPAPVLPVTVAADNPSPKTPSASPVEVTTALRQDGELTPSPRVEAPRIDSSIASAPAAPAIAVDPKPAQEMQTALAPRQAVAAQMPDDGLVAALRPSGREQTQIAADTDVRVTTPVEAAPFLVSTQVSPTRAALASAEPRTTQSGPVATSAPTPLVAARVAPTAISSRAAPAGEAVRTEEKAAETAPVVVNAANAAVTAPSEPSPAQDANEVHTLHPVTVARSTTETPAVSPGEAPTFISSAATIGQGKIQISAEPLSAGETSLTQDAIAATSMAAVESRSSSPAISELDEQKSAAAIDKAVSGERIYIRVATFAVHAHALHLAAKLKSRGAYIAQLRYHGKPYYRVWIESVGLREDAEEALASVRALGFRDAWITARRETPRRLARSRPTQVASRGR